MTALSVHNCNVHRQLRKEALIQEEPIDTLTICITMILTIQTYPSQKHLKINISLSASSEAISVIKNLILIPNIYKI
jgi:hypothetical protein